MGTDGGHAQCPLGGRPRVCCPFLHLSGACLSPPSPICTLGREGGTTERRPHDSHPTPGGAPGAEKPDPLRLCAVPCAEGSEPAGCVPGVSGRARTVLAVGEGGERQPVRLARRPVRMRACCAHRFRRKGGRGKAGPAL